MNIFKTTILGIAFTLGMLHGKHFDAQAATVNLYADPNAVSTSPCTNIAAPCTLSGAIGKLASNSCNTVNDCIVHARGGIYYIGNSAGGDVIDITNSGFSGHPIIIQAYGWTAIGARTQEAAILDLTGPIPGGWTACTSCPTGGTQPSAGVCPGVPATACAETWYATTASGSGCMGRFEGIEKATGELAYAVGTASDLTNSHTTGFGAYNASRCSGETWRACTTSSDCYNSETCVANASPEVDTFTCNKVTQNVGCAFAANETWVYARWGAGGPPAHPYAISQCVGNAFRIQGSVGYVEIRGFVIRNSRNESIGIHGGAHDITLKDNVIAYNAGQPSGGDYGLCLCSKNAGGDNLTAISNEIMYTQSESFHTEAISADAPSIRLIQNNYIHNIGDTTITGPAANIAGHSHSTPTCLTLTNDDKGRCSGGTNIGANCTPGNNGPCAGGGTCSAADAIAGNYTGSIVEGNLFAKHNLNNTNQYCINLENNSDGWIIRNNVFSDISGACIFGNATAVTLVAGSVNSEQIYNNLMINCNSASNGQGAISFNPTTIGTDASSNLVYNNTIVNSRKPGIFFSYGDITIGTGNLFRNNLIYTTNNDQQIYFNGTDASNKFDHNILFTPLPISTIAFWRGTNYSCSTLGSIDATNSCQDPGFYDVTHSIFYPIGGTTALFPPSHDGDTNTLTPPTLDAGTATGMPGGKTTGIVNTLAAQHGFGFYSDSVSQGGSAWDIGAVESLVSYGNTPVGWSGYTPTGCSGGAATNPGTDGNGFVFRTQRDPNILCNGVSETLTLTVGQHYYVYFRVNSARSVDDITVDASTPPNYVQVADSTCGDDRVDDWSLDATNATIEEARYGSTNPNRGTFNTKIMHIFLLTPTSASVTLKAQVKSGGIYLTCPDTVYFFDPIVALPIPGYCSITKYRSCVTAADCPAGGESCL